MTRLKKIQQDWESLAQLDPHWAVLSDPAKKGGGWDDAEFFKSGRDEIAGVMTHLSKVAPELPRGRALDFGSGLGRLTQALAEYFDAVVGVDISTTMVEKATAAAANQPGCTFVLNTSSDLALLDDSSFDFVYSRIVLQHIPRTAARGYVREFVRVLRPGGIAIFQVPSSPLSVKGRLRVAGGGLWMSVSHAVRPSSHWESRSRLFGIPREQVLDDIRQAGGAPVEVTADGSTGEGWESWLYTVVKL